MKETVFQNYVHTLGIIILEGILWKKRFK